MLTLKCEISESLQVVSCVSCDMTFDLGWFLAASKEHGLHLDQYSMVHIVLGNEACDLDSVVCAIVYAFNLCKLALDNGDSNQTVIPVLNIPREDYRLRTEITYTLGRFGVNASDLTFIDEINLLDLLRKGKLAITLVDHNILAQHQMDLRSVLVEVIDHHKDELPTSPHYNKTVEPVGSCSTLIAEKILKSNPALLDRQVTCISLLLSSILLDTVNLDPRAGRMTIKDELVVKKLKGSCGLGFSVNELYIAVSKAKFDVAGLTSMEILRKDYKAVPTSTSNPLKIGISSIGLRLETFLSRDNITDTIQEFCTSRELDAFVVMVMYFDSLDCPPMRQLCVCGPCEDGVKSLAAHLERDEQLQLNAIDGSLAGYFCFNQQNVKASRKVVFPLVMEFLKI